MTFPFPGAEAPGKIGHLVQYRVNLRHDILTIHPNLFVARGAQRHVQHRPVLGEIDLVAAEHRIDFSAQAAFLGQAQQQPQGLVGEAMLGIVEIQPRRFQ